MLYCRKHNGNIVCTILLHFKIPVVVWYWSRLKYIGIHFRIEPNNFVTLQNKYQVHHISISFSYKICKIAKYAKCDMEMHCTLVKKPTGMICAFCMELHITKYRSQQQRSRVETFVPVFVQRYFLIYSTSIASLQKNMGDASKTGMETTNVLRWNITGYFNSVNN